MHRYGLALIGAALLLAACGGKETMASKSAAAYHEAQAKGTPVGAGNGHDHGGAAASASSPTMDHGATAPADHAAMGHGTGAEAHAGHSGGADPATTQHLSQDHSAHGVAPTHAQHGATPASAHAQHGAATSSTHPGMQHDAATHATPGQSSTSQMDHSQHAGMPRPTSTPPADSHAQHQQPAGAPPHAGHGPTQPAAGLPGIVLDVPTSNAEIARTQPSKTLQPDDFDAPARISVAEARKAAGGEHDGHGTPSPPADPHAGHDTASSTEQAVYTCPMHPEVTSATPGTCPKCGMQLVKKEK